MGYFSFPHTRTYESDLGWLIKKIGEVDEKLSEYLENAVITFADPIGWNITEQYTSLTMVVDSDGTAYLSRQPVPAGVDISNTDYWMPVFNYDDNINKLRATIAANEETSGTATAPRTVGDLVYLEGDLYKIIADMPIGTQYVIGSNCIRYTVSDRIADLLASITANTTAIETETTAREQAVQAETTAREQAVQAETEAREQADTMINNSITTISEAVDSLETKSYKTVMDYGALGDGVHDDTQAFIDCASAETEIIVPANHIYRITNTVTITSGKTLRSDNAANGMDKTVMQFTNGGLVVAGRFITVKDISISVPLTSIAITLKGDSEYSDSHMITIENISIYGGLWAISRDLQDTSYTVWCNTFKNIRINDSSNGIQLGTTTHGDSFHTFTNVYLDHVANEPIHFYSVNATFIGCDFGYIEQTHMYFRYGCNITFIGCNFESDEKIEAYMIGAYGETFKFLGCRFRVLATSSAHIFECLANATVSILFENCTYASVTGNELVDFFHPQYMKCYKYGAIVYGKGCYNMPRPDWNHLPRPADYAFFIDEESNCPFPKFRGSYIDLQYLQTNAFVYRESHNQLLVYNGTNLLDMAGNVVI